jgi:hypothetical protein
VQLTQLSAITTQTAANVWVVVPRLMMIDMRVLCSCLCSCFAFTVSEQDLLCGELKKADKPTVIIIIKLPN